MNDEQGQPCRHTWQVLQMTFQEGASPRGMHVYGSSQEKQPDVTHLLLACVVCGETRHEQMPGTPVIQQ